MRLLHDPVNRFSHLSPIYNWIYPIAGARRSERYSGNLGQLLRPHQRPSNRPRALYLHVPFCQTICTFCPLVKGPLSDPSTLNTYVRAVVSEIALKARDQEITRLPIRSVFFGGGTPSLLHPDHIQAIGAALHDAFDFSALEEFSIEMEAKSIAPEALAAFRAIGVTHARFGVQTFAARHREAFNLTASIEQIHRAASLLKSVFPYVSCDMLYGLHGQTADELFSDIDLATSLGLNNIDFYPLNIFVIQKKLHRNYKQNRQSPLSGLTKFYMTKLLRDLMRIKGFLPHNGHGYVRVTPEEIAENPVVTRSYAFKYHQSVYGGYDDEFIGIGNSALSYIGGATIANELSRERYVKDLLSEKSFSVDVVDHPPHVNAAKIVAIGLPYLGGIQRDRIFWNDLNEVTEPRLAELTAHGLIEQDENEIRLTHDGWLWYVNLMFYLAPREEQAAIAAMVLDEAKEAFLPSETVELLTMTA